MALETEQKTLSWETVSRGVAAMLSNDSLGFYLVAIVDEQVTGCLAVTYEWSDWRNGQFWWIQSVYVDEQYRGQGVFSAMYQRVKEMALGQDGVCGIRLYVEVDNHRAQRTYFRLGMQETHYRLLEEEF